MLYCKSTHALCLQYRREAPGGRSSADTIAPHHSMRKTVFTSSSLKAVLTSHEKQQKWSPRKQNTDSFSQETIMVHGIMKSPARWIKYIQQLTLMLHITVYTRGF